MKAAVSTGDLAASLAAVGIAPKCRLVTSSKIYNTIQQYKMVLVLDLRETKAYARCHLAGAISLPATTLTETELLNYDPNRFAETHCPKAPEAAHFGQRKRLMIFIIPSQRSVRRYHETPSPIPKKSHDTPARQHARQLQLKGLLKAYMLYKCLMSERIREVYLHVDGFKEILREYPFLCAFWGNRIFLEP
jgi:hypothetical protein